VARSKQQLKWVESNYQEEMTCHSLVIGLCSKCFIKLIVQHVLETMMELLI